MLLESEDAEAWIHALTTTFPVIHAREYTLKTFGWDAVAEKYKNVFTNL